MIRALRDWRGDLAEPTFPGGCYWSVVRSGAPSSVALQNALAIPKHVRPNMAPQRARFSWTMDGTRKRRIFRP
jgi:hypothetical protein